MAVILSPLTVLTVIAVLLGLLLVRASILVADPKKLQRLEDKDSDQGPFSDSVMSSTTMGGD